MAAEEEVHLMGEEHKAISRRGFVKASAAGAALTVMSARAALGSEANSSLAVGIVGCGWRGPHVASKLKAHTASRVVALADVFQDRLDAAKQTFSGDSPRTFRGFDSYRELLDVDVDAVIIASPPYYHPEQFEAAVDAGKHVYLEKPVAVDTSGSLRVKATGDKAAGRLTVLVGFQNRSRADIAEGIARVHGGAIGRVACGKAHYNSGWLDPRDKPGESEEEARIRNWVFDKVLSGDILVEQNIHVIDLCNWALGAHPVKAYGSGGRKIRTQVGDTWDRYEVLFWYPDDVALAFTSTQFLRLGWDNAGEAFYGPKGDMEVFGLAEEAGRVRIRGDNPWSYDETPGDPEVARVKAFYESIVEGKHVNEAAQGVEATLSTILGRTAAYRGREYGWDEMLRENETLEL
jgi:predicted dehydrogenase